MSFYGTRGSSVVSSPAPAVSFNVLTISDTPLTNNFSQSKSFIQGVAKDTVNANFGDRPLAAKLYVKFGRATGYRSQASIYNLIRRARNRFAK